METFVHFNVQTSASFGTSLLHTHTVVDSCRKKQMPALALCDLNNAFLAMRFAKDARASGIQPIHGARLSIDCASLSKKQSSNQLHRAQVAVIVTSPLAWKNLCQLITAGWVATREHKEFVLTWEQLCTFKEDLILLDGGSHGPVAHFLNQGRKDDARACLEEMARAFPDRCYVELMRQTPEDQKIEPICLNFSAKVGLPILASHRVRFLEETDAKTHEVLACIIQQYKIQDEERPRSFPEQTLSTPEEMRRRFHDLPEACDNTVNLAQRVSFALDDVKTIFFPRFPKLEGKSEHALLDEKARAGLKERLRTEVFPHCTNEKEQEAYQNLYEQRLNTELDLLAKVGYEGYFLIVADFIEFANRNNIPVGVGRGSAAGSMVAWSLNIMGIDPIKYDLLFERFINPERLSPPDIDIDFCQDRRDEVIRYVQQQYGTRNVAHIITFGRMQARAVTRDVGRVLGLSYGYVDSIVRLIPSHLTLSNITLRETLSRKSPHYNKELGELYQQGEIKQLLDFAVRLEGLYRNASMHAAGIVIAERPLDHKIPLYCDTNSNMLATQFDMDDIAAMGMLKFDFLGLTTLSILKRTQKLLKKRSIDCPLPQIPRDDAATFQMLKKDRVMGVFQLESDGMRRVIRDLQPDNLEEMIALIALFRPGPMRNIPHFIDRKHKREPITYPHSLLESILKETYGIPVYQEQVMRMAQIIAGFSLQEADLLRIAMSKKILDKIQGLKKSFIEGAQFNGIEEKTAQNIFEQMTEFANYGFNKSHAAAYGLTSYYTAYLKCHYPAEYLAACMSYCANDGSRLALLVQEAKHCHVRIEAPDINLSEVDFEVIEDGQAIRYGFTGLKNIGQAVCEAIVTIRNKNGPFESIEDAFRRLSQSQINTRALETLIDADCFKTLESDSKLLNYYLPSLTHFQHVVSRPQHSNQQSLFSEEEIFPFPELIVDQGYHNHNYDPITREQKAFGYYFSKHPLEPFQHVLLKQDIVASSDLEQTRTRNAFKMAGVPISVRTIPTRRGGSIRLLNMSDHHGAFELTVFDETWSPVLKELIEAESPLLLNVALHQDTSRRQGRTRLTLISFQDLSTIRTDAYKSLTIYAEYRHFDPQALENVIRAYATKGREKVRFILAQEDGTKLKFEAADHGYKVDARLLRALQELPGVTEIKQV